MLNGSTKHIKYILASVIIVLLLLFLFLRLFLILLSIAHIIHGQPEVSEWIILILLLIIGPAVQVSKRVLLVVVLHASPKQIATCAWVRNNRLWVLVVHVGAEHERVIRLILNPWLGGAKLTGVNLLPTGPVIDAGNVVLSARGLLSDLGGVGLVRTVAPHHEVEGVSTRLFAFFFVFFHLCFGRCASRTRLLLLGSIHEVERVAWLGVLHLRLQRGGLDHRLRLLLLVGLSRVGLDVHLSELGVQGLSCRWGAAWLGYRLGRGLIFLRFVGMVAVVEASILFVLSVLDFAVDVSEEIFEGFIIFLFLFACIMFLFLPWKIRGSVWLRSKINISHSSKSTTAWHTSSKSHSTTHRWLSCSKLISHHPWLPSHHSWIHASHIWHGGSKLLWIHGPRPWHLESTTHAWLRCKLVHVHSVSNGSLVLLSHVSHVLHDFVQLTDRITRLRCTLRLSWIFLHSLLLLWHPKIVLLHAHVLLRLRRGVPE